jgi:hypothetical protein
MTKDNIDRIKILECAMWIMADKVQQRINLELLFGEGYTETELVCSSREEAEYEFEHEEIKHRQEG